MRGSAQDLPFLSNYFDIVLNLESSHCYPEFEKFLTEVARVLRPGGLFIFADLRWGNHLKENLERQLNQSNLEMISLNNITKNVAEARKSVSKQMTRLDRMILRNNKVIENHFPLEGSSSYESLLTGGILYFDAVLKKEETPNS